MESTPGPCCPPAQSPFHSRQCLASHPSLPGSQQRGPQPWSAPRQCIPHLHVMQCDISSHTWLALFHLFLFALRAMPTRAHCLARVISTWVASRGASGHKQLVVHGAGLLQQLPVRWARGHVESAYSTAPACWTPRENVQSAVGPAAEPHTHPLQIESYTHPQGCTHTLLNAPTPSTHLGRRSAARRVPHRSWPSQGIGCHSRSQYPACRPLCPPLSTPPLVTA